MTQQVTERPDETRRALIDSKLAQTETWFRDILDQVNLRTKTKKEVMNSIEQLIRDFPLAVPLICEMARAQFPDDAIITNEYLIVQTINSYNARLAGGDRTAILEKYNYLASIKRKENPEGQQEEEAAPEDGEQ